jgi:hypothetical protein
MAPELVKEFIAEYHAELNRLMARREGDNSRQRAKLVKSSAGSGRSSTPSRRACGPRP